MRFPLWSLLALCGLLFMMCGVSYAQAQASVLLNSNMKVLNCTMPGNEYRFLGSTAPGQLFMPGEAVTIHLAIKKSAGPFALEIQEITTRDPERREASMEGFTDTGGHALIIGLEGKPILFPLAVAFDDKPEKLLDVSNLPIPARFGTYAVVLLHGKERTFLATVARVPAPRPEGTVDNTPIFGEGQFFNGNLEEKIAIYQRMGVRGARCEWSWNETEDGKVDWSGMDKTMEMLHAHGMQVMVTLGGMGGWKWPFKTVQSPGAVGANWDGNPYGGQSDWVCGPELYPRYGKWITAFAQRYWKDGKGGLWGFENYNEPWEGGGISGWARDMVQYRELQKTIANAVHGVDPRIKVCAACSIMNTEDKLYPEGSNEFDKYIDVFTDHYVVPPMSYGPMVAKAHGKQSAETETWVANSEYSLPQVMAQFLASGQDRVSPWHPRVLFDDLNNTLIPSPTVVATAAFNAFVTGKHFEKVVYLTHLPWVFQFGKDDDNDALLVLFGQLTPQGSDNPKACLWSQVNNSPGGTITIDNHDKLLQFFDLAGNPQYVGKKTINMPMSIFPAYIKCKKGPLAAAERLRKAIITGKHPVEILPYDFTTRVAPGTALRVGVHNCLNRALTGTLAVKTPDGMTLKTSVLPVQLAAGETATVVFSVAAVTVSATNAYPLSYTFTSPAGNAAYAEVMNAAIVTKKTITVDGNLDDWQDVPGVRVLAGGTQIEQTELMRRPWLDIQKQKPDGSFGEFKLAWDDNYLYVAAIINDATPQPGIPRMEGRDENKYFHSKADDDKEPFKSWLPKNAPGHSMAEIPFVWATSPEGPADPTLPVIPFRRDRLQIALDVTDGMHDMKGDADRVPYLFHAMPDTDYEYALYLCKDGSELWRQLAPGVPRIHDWPRQPRGARTTGPVPGAQHVVKLDGHTYIYEMAIPRAELADLKLQPGTTFGLALRGGNNTGAHVDYGADKAVNKLNGLTLHPYWETSPSCGVRWTLVE